MIKEAKAVVDIWTDDTVLWYMQEYRDLGYEKVADIFSKAFTISAKQMAQELIKNHEEEEE